MKIENQRLCWADYVKAFSIMCVILHHTQIAEPWYSISYQLCLAGFFFISGIFMPTYLQLKEFIIIRAKQLLIPYLFFGCLAYIIWYFIGRKMGTDIDSTTSWWTPIIGLIIGTRNSLIVYPPLWFLPTLFISEIIVFSINAICKKNIYQILLILVCIVIGFVLANLQIILPWGITSALVMTSIVALGQKLHLQESTITKSFSTLKLVHLLVICIIAFVLFYNLNTHTEISCAQFGKPLIFLINSIIVSFLWIALSILLERYTTRLPLLSLLGQSTLIILCLHLHVFGLIKAITIYCLHLPITIFDSNIGKIGLWGTSIFILLLICSFFQIFQKKQYA